MRYLIVAAVMLAGCTGGPAYITDPAAEVCADCQPTGSDATCTVPSGSLIACAGCLPRCVNGGPLQRDPSTTQWYCHDATGDHMSQCARPRGTSDAGPTADR